MHKVLIIDTANDGHHMPYLKGILKLNDNFVVAIPKTKCNFDSKVIYISNFSISSFRQYKKWLKEINKIIDNEKPEIVHFLYGDVFYRFFGIGLNSIRKKCKKTIVTFHQFRIKPLVKVSLRRILKKINLGIVHTNYNQNELKQIGIKNIHVIDYPQLYNFEISNNQENLKEKYNLNKNEIVFSLVGGIMGYKGIEVLFDAISKMKKRNFKVILAGKLYDYTNDQIELMIKDFKDHIIFKPGFLSDEVFLDFIGIADYVILPYRKAFDGASGPLTEAVWARKPVIASDSKALGEIVETHKLGYIFQCENSNELADIMDYAIDNKFEWNNTAEDFRNKITINNFIKSYTDVYKID